MYKGSVETLHEGDEFAGHRILGVAAPRAPACAAYHGGAVGTAQ